MRVRSLIAMLAAVAAMLPAGAAFGASSSGTYDQISWVRRAASNFVGDELRGDGAGACSILKAPLRGTQRHRTCPQRWAARLSKLLREPAARGRLRADARAIPSATVIVHGNTASIHLPAPLMDGSSRFEWTENCWMLEG